MASKKKHDDEKLKNVEDELSSEAAQTPNEDISKEAADQAEQPDQTEQEVQNALQEEIKGLNDRYLRLQADFLNYKARTEKEKTSTYTNAVSDLLLDLLPVVDNFERALGADSTDGGSYKEGVQMVYTQLMGILDKKGLKEISALHQPFDHNLHYGVGFEASDEFVDDTVIDVLQKGYTVNDKCIRPAMVRISKN